MQAQVKTAPIKPFGLRMPDDVKKWAVDQAKKERTSLNSFLLRLLDEKRKAQHANVV